MGTPRGNSRAGNPRIIIKSYKLVLLIKVFRKF
jgi:hypothetical protein